ncbi:MAG: DUF1501 domain-containing protein [Planctomycetota bacterium]|nr:DUF1501 domain-containing protein [Planctomycetota bacterium]
MSKYTRRSFLRSAMYGAAAITITPIRGLPSAMASTGAGNNGKFLVLVNLLGGNDGLNTVIPTHLTPYTERRPTLAITEGIHDLTGGWGLHPNLQNCKSLWDDGQLHVVQKVGYPNENLSHFTSQNIYSYGVRDYGANGDGRGWLGRFADTYCTDPVEPLGVVSVGAGRRLDFESNEGEALVLDNVPNFNFDVDTDFRTDHDLRKRTARAILDEEAAPGEGSGLTIFNTSKQAHELVDRVQAGVVGWTDPNTYFDNTLGRRMKEVSRLLHARDQFGTKVFYTGFGGFDTHSNQLGRHGDLMTQLDQNLGAFTADMKARGLWDDCVIVVISEFGRRNFENGSAGTDHGHGNAFLVAGGGVDGGKITGDLNEADLNVNQPDFGYDFRELYADVVDNHLGLASSPIFPEAFQNTGDIRLLRP